MRAQRKYGFPYDPLNYHSNDPNQLGLNFGEAHMPTYLLDGKYNFDTETREIVNAKSGSGIPHDEPRMLLRAQDKCTVELLEFYLELCSIEGAPQAHLDIVKDCIKAFADWQLAHPDKVKVPD